jgi:hypothetical protein
VARPSEQRVCTRVIRKLPDIPTSVLSAYFFEITSLPFSKFIIIGTSVPSFPNEPTPNASATMNSVASKKGRMVWSQFFGFATFFLFVKIKASAEIAMSMGNIVLNGNSGTAVVPMMFTC